MQTGKETWKWGVVVLLLAIFLITANQAYQHIASQESFEPPDDWQKGDSWDLEHQSGPGAGQPMQMPQAGKNQTTPTVEMPAQEENSVTVPEAIVIEDDIDWNQSDATSEKQEKAVVEETVPAKAENAAPVEEVAPAKVEETLPTPTEVTPVENVAPAKAEESVPTTETVPAKVEETSSAIESAVQKAEEVVSTVESTAKNAEEAVKAVESVVTEAISTKEATQAQETEQPTTK